ncbi:MAG: OsmC family protein [Alistipes sp.]|nr:OsmC family protein [Alistipes sp.]MBQ8544352.1 OsmC family protein [Alistipes sp.]MBQ9962845.1 OsmC family protein [Alistipes sp.]MBR3702140.1 OsmC family protein [Alistipes sp.]
MNNNLQKVTVKLADGKFCLAGGASADDLNPKALMLCATAKCAGLTIMALLEKRGNPKPKSMEITVEGQLNTPTLRGDSVYESFEVIYNVECHRLEDQEPISQAVERAQERTCGMVVMLRKIAPVSHVIEVVSTE